MHRLKQASCPAWILATALAWMVTALLVVITVIDRFPQMGWLVPALGAGMWVTFTLLWAAWKLQKDAPENELHPLLYFVAIAFAVVAGSAIFIGAIHQALAH